MKDIKMKWGNPLFEVQEFVPQEFVASCDVYRIRRNGRYYEYWLDYLSPYGTRNQGTEDFDTNGNCKGSSQDGSYSNVVVYYLSQKSGEYMSWQNINVVIKNGTVYNVS